MSELAPICLFVYNRLDKTKLTLEALQKNDLAAASALFIFSDGAKNSSETDKVNAVRQYISTIKGFKSVTIYESPVNKGLAHSIINGVSEIINQYGKVIVLEDDLITSPNFLDFINQGLDFYATDRRIFNINGYSLDLPSLRGYQKDYYLGYRASSWGWGTWKDRWNGIDWELSGYSSFNLSENLAFSKGGSDMPYMLWKQQRGIIDSWAIRWCYFQFKSGKLSVIAAKSKVVNIGIGADATNTKKSVRFHTDLDSGENRSFRFDTDPETDQILVKEFTQVHSIRNRILDRFPFNALHRHHPNNKGFNPDLQESTVITDHSLVTGKKLVVFHPALAPYRVDFFNQLSKEFNAVFYFSLDNVREQQFDQEKLRKGINFKFNLLTNGFEWQNRSVRFGIYRILNNQKPEIVICSEYSPVTISVAIYKLLVKRKLRVYTISDDNIDLSVKRSGIRKWMRNILSHILDGVIFPSAEVGKWYNENVNDKTKTFELPIIHSNSIFRAKLSQSLPLSVQNIQKYNLIDKKVFLFVGRLVKIKNVDLLVKSFARVKRTNEVLIIVGEGDEKLNLMLLAEELKIADSLIFTGRLEGVALISWYNIGQCFVLPSYHEPYGAVVNEALIAGCFVLCSKLAGASALIDEKNGYLFNPDVEQELITSIEKVSQRIDPLSLPLNIKEDLMPFRLEDKLNAMFSQL